MNPVNVAMRCLFLKALSDSKFWFHGPDFLKNADKLWPNLSIGDKFDIYDPENLDLVREYNDEGIVNFVAAKDVSDNQNSELLKNNLLNIIDVEKYSSLKKLIAVTAYVLKFTNILLSFLRNNDQCGMSQKVIKGDVMESKVFLSANEVNASKQFWIKSIQQKYLINDSNFLQLKKQLHLFCDDNGLWRCGGRLEHADVTFETNNPCLLPRLCYFTKLVILNSHEEVKHNGVKETLNNLRREFWIVKSRNLIRKIIRTCWLCNYFEGKSYNYPTTPALPKFRVQQDYAFSCTGIDYAGPFFVRNIYGTPISGNMYKCWMVLFTCASFRCIYLDLVPDCSGNSCVLALKRFIHSRGAPKLIISDNGSSFDGRLIRLGITCMNLVVDCAS